MSHEYLFDAVLMASFRVRATTEEAARRKLADALECADANFGMIDEEPLLAEASLRSEDPNETRPLYMLPILIEVDGEATGN